MQAEGRVVQTLGKHHLVLWQGKVVEAFPAGRLELASSGRKNRVAVGDRVRLRAGRDGRPLIEAVLPRGNTIARRISFTGACHVLASNLDAVAVMLAPNPGLNTGLLDRYLVAAHCSGVEALVVVNKMDLLTEGEVREALAPYGIMGYAVYRMAARDGRGVPDFLRAVAGRWVLLAGHSGVGKTTLVMAAQPGLARAVGAVRPGSGKGRHTTTSAEAHLLQDGTVLVDTAGIREFAPWGVGWRGVAEGFREICEAGAACRFADCRHLSEPGCAVRDAADSGTISAARYESYCYMVTEAEETEGLTPARA